MSKGGATKEKGEEDEGGGEGKKEGALPVIPRTRRWEKGHRMALSSGSSVSEDVWTLIKMCRASGAVSFFFRSLVLSLFLLSRSTVPSFALQLLARCVHACDRTQEESRLLKRPGSVTWIAAAARYVYASLRVEKSSRYATRGYVVTSCHRASVRERSPSRSTGR